MTILALDTSLDHCSIALGQNDGVIFDETVAMSRGHAESILPMIEKLLEKHSVHWSDLTGVITTSGPGAFTGLRVGISCANALATALSIPACSYTTLEIMAWQYKHDMAENFPDALCVVAESRRDDFYMQIFNKDLDVLALPQVIKVEDLSGILSRYQTAAIVGTAYEHVKTLSGSKTIVSVDYDYPVAPSIIQVEYEDRRIEKIKQKYVEPFYLQPVMVSSSNKV